MDQRLLGKIGDTIGDARATKGVNPDSPVRGRDSAQQTKTGDTVELTSSAKLLERLEKTLASMPEIDSARVAAVKAQIQNGEYHIDVEKIADALMQEDKDFGG